MVEEEKTELTEEEKEEVKNLLGYGGNTTDAKHSVHSFLFNVATAEDTTRLGNLDATEIGKLTHPIRGFKHLANFTEKILNKKGLSNYFLSESEIGTSTSLSKDGFLTKLAVVTRKELADVSPKEKKANKSWFKSKDKPEEKVE